MNKIIFCSEDLYDELLNFFKDINIKIVKIWWLADGQWVIRSEKMR